MESQRLFIMCTILLLSIERCFTVDGTDVNSTEANISVTISGDHVSNGTGSDAEQSFDEDEEEEDVLVLGYITDDSIRVEPVVKPQNPEKSTEKKNTDKKKKGRGGKKKMTPCQTTHKDYCIHGQCKYLAKLKEVSCICHQDFFGERCSELSMKSGINGPFSDMSTIALAVVAVLLSTISITAIIIIIVIQ
ncbi:hypothetical protein GDO86_000753 [Hymenochirus boettgeri]|uniref:EGF-like domain-containing protein n=1 Tax=Hymenochirus boettgeri TaxID=247094 RepID=A0A8T2KAR5_9PIPI|nr:hypothetical protein GDO86_000753 [Hymenochirus boettgeri]